MRIVVLCNDRLALPALQLLMQNRLLLSVGLPDRKSEPAEVIRGLCVQNSIPVQKFTKQNLEQELEAWLILHQPDVVLVKTFPWLIPSRLLGLPKYGFINFHYAPLPEYRGPSPLFWMIRDQAKELGVSIHRMTTEFDAGEILFQHRLPLQPHLTYGMCTAQLAYTGAELTAMLLRDIAQSTLKPVPQNGDVAQWYKRPTANDLRITWDKMTAHQVNALVKACNPWAKGAPVKHNGWTFGLTETTVLNTGNEGARPGTIVKLNEQNGLIIACQGNDSIRADVIYTEEGFLPGHRLSLLGLNTGAILE